MIAHVAEGCPTLVSFTSLFISTILRYHKHILIISYLLIRNYDISFTITHHVAQFHSYTSLSSYSHLFCALTYMIYDSQTHLQYTTLTHNHSQPLTTTHNHSQPLTTTHNHSQPSQTPTHTHKLMNRRQSRHRQSCSSSKGCNARVAQG